MHRRLAAISGAVLLTLCAVGVALALRGHPTAPPSTDLPLASTLRITDQLVSGSAVQSSISPRQFRYMLVVGPPGTTVAKICLAELDLLRRHGWTVTGKSHDVTSVANTLAADPYTEAYLLSPKRTVRVGISTFPQKLLRDRHDTLSLLPDRPPLDRPSFLAVLTFHAAGGKA
jgi:hypothetical protein